MNVRREIEKKIERKKEDLAGLERQMAETRAYIQALEDTKKMLPRDTGEPEGAVRPGTELAKVYEILKKSITPLHVDEILRRLGKPVSKKTKVSLSGSLGIYVRDQRLFSRPAPNTFGLIGAATPLDEPPEDFGQEHLAHEGNNGRLESS